MKRTKGARNTATLRVGVVRNKVALAVAGAVHRLAPPKNRPVFFEEQS
ncbi:hypothetical protein [Caballeronia mineralivorans]|nr:hypothetical protein [Caballeronia mineralivorans]